MSHLLGDAADPFGLDDSNSKSTKPGDVFRTITYPYPAAILVIVPINDVVAAVLDNPVLTVDLEHMLRVGLFASSTGNSIGNIQRAFAGLFLYAVPLDDECLSDVREVEVRVELRGCPDLSGFDSSVIGGRMLNTAVQISTETANLDRLNR